MSHLRSCRPLPTCSLCRQAIPPALVSASASRSICIHCQKRFCQRCSVFSPSGATCRECCRKNAPAPEFAVLEPCGRQEEVDPYFYTVSAILDHYKKV